MLRNKADRQTVLYIFITTALLIVQWNLETLQPVLYIWMLLMALAVSIIAHNHNHVRIWKSKFLNHLMDLWLTIFYGFPSFGWIPTHNANHHKFINRMGDYTMTYQHTEKNNLWTLITYPPTASIRSFGPVRDYIRQLWHNKQKQLWYCLLQYALLGLVTAVALWLDWKKALLYLIVPQQVSMYSVMLFNYLQHVDTDEESEYNHSRNFVGSWLNLFLFNNGYHMVHHRTPGLHWSCLKEAHNRVADHVHPTLLERNIIWMIIRTYILGLFIPRFRPTSLRLERIEKGANWV